MTRRPIRPPVCGWLLRGRRPAVLLAALALVLAAAGCSRAEHPDAAAGTVTPAAASTTVDGNSPVPLLAFYYAWFDPASWSRAKTDYPLLGRYSSDDVKVMAQQIQWAKSAGIEGFIVSWKDSPVNDRRLEALMRVARAADFKLAMIYQGLDFHRHPLPVARVAADFATFQSRYAPDPVFLRLGGKPLTIWSGTWAFTHSQVTQVTAAVRNSLLVLNTEKSVSGYQRIADATDGDAYYWSSVNPATNTNYDAKLRAMSSAVHRDGKYWIAPFSPGFDARLVGGAKTVDRKDGQTLRTEYAAAVASSPDALGLISWNEFSENTYIEPSQKYGMHYLDVLRQLRTTTAPVPASAQDSSESHTTGPSRASLWPNALRLGGFTALLAAAAAVPALRGRRRRQQHRPVETPSNSRR